ncbi:hypothetical protein Bbelb_226600, partial [Branchiostoma belcheri]
MAAGRRNMTPACLRSPLGQDQWLSAELNSPPPGLLVITTIQPITQQPTTPLGCEYNGRFYPAGTTISETTGCMGSGELCDENGEILVWDNFGFGCCERDGQYYEDGETFTEGGVTCTCVGSENAEPAPLNCGVTTTPSVPRPDTTPPTPPAGCEYDGRIYPPGTTISETTGCRGSGTYCDENGQIYVSDNFGFGCCERDGQYYQDGETFTEGRVTCTCVGSRDAIPAPLNCTEGDCRGRWSTPEGCRGDDCDHSVSWTYNSDTDEIFFEMSARQTSDKWIGIGFSNDQLMANSDVIVAAVSPEGSVSITDRWASRRSMPTQDGSDDVENPQGSYNNGVINVNFTRQRNTGDDSDLAFTDDDCLYMFYALGGTYDHASQTLSKHATTPTISDQRICIRGDCPATEVCGENSYFNSCGHGDCQPTCEEPAPICTQVCIPGCQCNAGFALRDGRCIPRSQCEGGGDYLDCSEPEVFWCDNGMCVHQNRTCNDEDNCGDRSDERGCPTGACKSSPCMNGASCCDLGDDKFSCLCRLGYHGETCDNFTDPCASESRCENGGTCMRWEMGGDTPPEYSCQCPPHFTGVTCEIPLPTVCDENTCENGGRCVTMPMPCMEGSGDCPEFRCVCPAGVTGYRCEFALGMCEEDSCFNDGECMQVPCKDYYSCECRNGTAGARCQSTGIIDCSEPEVFWCDNGMCVHQNRTCNDEDNCGDRSDERGCPTGACKSSPCMNGASCCDLGDDKFSCLCRLGYHGETCGNFTDPCASPDNNNPCANGGTCMSMDMGDEDGDSVRSEYSCQCPPGFTGMTCEIPLPTVCDENTCENGGRCVTAACSEGSEDCDPEFRCVCPPGVTGYRCEFVLGMCEEESCFNDGECMQVPCKDYYSCECRNGFNGPRCAMGESDAAFAVIRLVGGSTEYEGRVEVRNRTGNGEWGTICDDDFDINAANVVCKQLGYGPALEYTESYVFGEGSGPIWLDDVRCAGDEESLLDCPSGAWGEHNCDHDEDVGVICSLEIRLAEGTTSTQGRVEIRLGNGEWGTICDDSFDMDDAHVVCRQLGYKFATSYEGSAYFGQGNGSIWLDDVECEGDEENLLDCSSSGWGQHNCGHSEDVGVVCAVQCEPINIGMCRNVVQYNTTAFPNLLGHVSQQSFLTDQDSVNVITALMNSGCHPDVEFAVCSALVPNCIDSVQITPCKDFCNDVRASCEQVLLDLGWPWPFNCSRLNDRTQCITPYPVVVSTELTLPDEVFTEELNNMTSPRYRMLAGTLESEASKAFSSPGSVRATLGLEFQSSGQPLSSDETVVGTLRQYVNETGGRLGNLSVSQVNVALPPAEIRLVGGSRRNEGRVEIRRGNGEWGTICDDSFDINDAHVVCRQLGYGLAESYENSFYFGYGSGPIWLDEVECEGDEKNLLDCPSFGWGRHDCDHDEDVGVVCLVQCEPINIGMCRNVVPYNTTTFPNLLGHVSQQSFLTDQDSVNVITALMNSGCHPDVEFAVCSALVPNCIDSVQITPCRDFCNDIRASCEQVLVGRGQPWPFDCNSFNARTQCIRPYPVIVSTKLTLPDEVFSEDLNDRNSSRYRMLAGTLESEASKAFEAISSFRQATVERFRSGSVIAILGVQFQNNGQALPSDEAVVSTLRQYINDNGGRLGDLSVSQVDVVVPPAEIRLVGGATEYEGRVEIRAGDGEWGTICDDNFDDNINAANVVCRQLGYGPALQYTGSHVFGEGSGPIWLDDVRCAGDEESLLDCPSRDWGEHNCGHSEDVGVICSMEIRLVGGTNPAQGRVEIRRGNGEWGTVCDDSFDINDAHVVCRQLGYGLATSYEGFGYGSGPIWLDEVECEGDEENLLDCPSNGWGDHNCGHSEDVSVFCSVPWDLCTYFMGYNSTGFPNSFEHTSQLDIVLSAEYQEFTAVLANISICYPNIYEVYCQTFLPKCEERSTVFLCRSVCEEVNAACGPRGVFLPFSCDVFPADGTQECLTLASSSSSSCEPVPWEFCSSFIDYNYTGFPNSFDHASQLDLALSVEYQEFTTLLANLSICYPNIYQVYCPVFLPKCENGSKVFLCRSVCEEVNAACAPRGVSLPFSCDAFPADGTQECLTIASSTCDPIPWEFCSSYIDYDYTGFPNAFNHTSHVDVSISPEFQGLNALIPNISMCYPNIYQLYCSMFLPKCQNGSRVFLCRSVCEEVNAACGPRGVSLPFSCDVFPADGTQECLTLDAPTCQPIPYDRCRNMLYSETSFTPGVPVEAAIAGAESFFATSDSIAGCHTDLEAFVCSYLFPPCTSSGTRYPCASLCNEVNDACKDAANASGVAYDPGLCDRLPPGSYDEDCFVPQGRSDCDPIPFDRCQNMPYAGTSFPNWLGWQGPTDAIGNATAIFAALDQISDCHKDLEFFLCSLYFPSCTSTGVKFPCRSLCDEINNACALRALAIGIPWDTAGCITLPVSSYQEGCIAPKATCDGWPYECYGSPGSCVGAWEFCDGNGVCPYNDDEFACSNYTCMPIELEYCRGEVPYDRMTLPNYFGQESTMMIEESDIHRNVSLLADTSCHEYVKYVYCHMAVPECVMDGVRGQPLCRSLCEEIRQTCAEEIKEIGFQFEKSTCDLIFPDSVQNDTCKLAKEFNCTFDDDTCEWMAGNSSQAVMLQPASESNSGKYASLNGASAKLTSPTMYTDNKCLRMRYLVRGDGSRLTVYVTGPDGNSFSTWRQSSTYVSLDAYVAADGEVGVDDVTLSDGSCKTEEAVSPGCEPMKFESCLDMPYNLTTYPNALGWDRDLALSLGPHTFQAFDQIADCHRDLQFYLCSFIFPECTPFGMRLPCRSFCERVSEACATRANAAGLTWDPNGCQSLPDDEPYCSVPKGEGCPEGHYECYGSGQCVGPWQFCDGMPDCPFNDDESEVVCGRYECMPMDFEYCQDVVNYTRAFFPNYYGQQNVSVIEQSDIHQIAVSFASTNCHPDSNLFYCHLVVPECQENDVHGKPVCRAVCEEVRQECSDEVDALQVPLTKEWCYATFPDSVNNDTCILFRGLNCTFDDDFCNWDQVVRGSQPWTQVMSSSRQGKHITSSGPSSQLLVSPRIYTDDKCLRFYYMLTGSDTRVLLKLIGPNGVSWNAWNTTTSRSVSNQWTTASIGIKTGLDSVQVSIQAFADGDGSFSIDNITLSDGPCSKEVECEPIMIDVCRGVVPYTETLFPNLLGHSSQQAFLDDPNSVSVINQLMNSNCHPNIGFAVCSALVPRCVDSRQLPPCRGFCNEIRASCQPVLGMAGQEWPFECEAFPFEFQGECSTPAPAQCERIEIGMCRNVVPYNTTTFPNLLGHVSQQSFLTTPESVSVITALMNSACHPDVEFAVCSALVPNCIDSMQIPPCRDFCNEVKDSCEQLLMDIGESWPFECNDFAPRGRCISPDPVVVYAALTLPDEDFTDDLYDSSTPRYRVLTATLQREIPKAFETPVTVTVANLRPGSVIATVGMGFENTGQAPESDEAAIATLQQYVSGKRGRLGSLTVSQVVGVPPVDVTRPCDENPCGDNGVCEEVDGTFGMAAYRCTCQDGFTGYNCEIRIAGRCHESIQSVLSEQDGSPIVGVFLPQCRDDGSYENLQCHPSTGYCWCVTADGTEVPGTQTPPGQNRTDCVAAMSVELYPFGPGQGDTVVEFSDLDDGTSDRINIPAGFPFFYTRHSRFYIGVNGLVSFGRRYGSYIPVPFRTGSGNTRPVIAPFWADHDLRRRDGQSNVFYQEYRGKVVRLPANSGVRGVNADVAALAQNVVTRVISDVTAYADLSDDFDPSWIAVITWSNMTAYPSGSNPDQ